PACDAWLEAAAAYGLPRNPDFNGEGSLGIGRYQLTLDGHWRSSAGRSMLKPALSRPNLTLELRARVIGLIRQGRRVVGVRYLQDGVVHEVHADGEVILSAGSVQSPQILQLSGIGPADLLKAQGIEVVHGSPEVGENLQDHLQLRTIVTLANKAESLNAQVRNPLGLARMGLDWLLGQRGPLTVGAGQVGGAMCTKYADGDRPDLQLFVMPLSVDKPGTPLHRYPGFTTSFWQCHPESRGSVRITGTDPLADPEIRLNYLSTQRDCDVMVEGLRIVREIYNQPGFRDRWTQEVIPGAQHQSDDDILAAARAMSSTVYHLVGTCRMGNDPMAVVDSKLCVNGVEGLRVVDASVMPKITSANTNAATLMIAEKAADLIVGETPAHQTGRL
ncbi:MAG: GMC oxidoreductase, partial [Pseudomonadota bacterium]